MAKRGRSTKYTPDTVKTIIDTIRVGGSDVDACARAGIHQDTFYSWMKQHSDFSEQVTRARWDSKIERIARIRKHGENDWRADAWYLERRWPEEFAQQLIVKVTSEQASILKKHGLTASEAFEKLIQSLNEVENV
jgi:transposase-like protein